MNLLTRVTEGRDGRILPLNVPEVDVPFGESPDHDFD
jgi:hypothetical protein